MTQIDLHEIHDASVQRGERRAQFFGISVSRERIEQADLSCTDFDDCEFEYVTFVRVDLRGTSFERSKMHRVRFIDCAVFGTEFGENASSIEFDNCRFDLTGARPGEASPPLTTMAK